MTATDVRRTTVQDVQSLRGARIAVVAGGLPHRDVAWPVIERISKTLTDLGYRNDIVDAERWDFVHRVAGFDVAFVADYGVRGGPDGGDRPGGDDGTVQGTLAALGIPYTGSGSKATALAQDKVLAKTLFRAHDIATPDFMPVEPGVDPTALAADALGALGSPLVVKPVLAGGSYGLSLARTVSEVVDAIAAAGPYGPVFLEAFVAGRTLTSGVLGIGPDRLVLTPHEVTFRDDRPFLDPVTLFEKDASDTIYPARVSGETVYAVQRMAERAHRVLGAHGVSRSDFKVDADGQPWILELNTMPAMSNVSDLPIAAARAGLSFPALVEKILLTALDREWWMP